MDGIELVTCCGGYCGACVWLDGDVRDHAGALRSTLAGWCGRQRALGMLGEEAVDRAWPGFEALLGWLESGAGCSGCRAGGVTMWGDATCEVRDCVLGRGLLGCWECPDEETCERLKPLDEGDPNGRVNRRRIREAGLEAWIAEQAAFYGRPERACPPVAGSGGGA